MRVIIMAKIKVTHFAATGVYLYVIDNEGKIWRRHTERDNWTPSGEIPNAPAHPLDGLNIEQLLAKPDATSDSAEHARQGYAGRTGKLVDDGDIAFGPVEVGEEEQEAARKRELLS